MPTLTRTDDVFLLDLGGEENRFAPALLDELDAALDEVERHEGPRALVTVAAGRFWSNGLDLDWLVGAGDEAGPFLGRVQGLLARVLTLPLPTVAALQGHCFGAGALLAFAHDWRVMRADRGFLCLPEVDIQLPFTPGMGALVQATLPPASALEAMTTARRYGGVAAEQAALVTRAVPEAEVRDAARALVAPLTGKAGPTLGTIKQQMYAGVVTLLRSA